MNWLIISLVFGGLAGLLDARLPIATYYWGGEWGSLLGLVLLIWLVKRYGA